VKHPIGKAPQNLDVEIQTTKKKVMHMMGGFGMMAIRLNILKKTSLDL
jgi:hypothetical protein